MIDSISCHARCVRLSRLVFRTCSRAVSVACSCILSTSDTTSLSLDSREVTLATASAPACEASCTAAAQGTDLKTSLSSFQLVTMTCSCWMQVMQQHISTHWASGRGVWSPCIATASPLAAIGDGRPCTRQHSAALRACWQQALLHGTTIKHPTAPHHRHIAQRQPTANMHEAHLVSLELFDCVPCNVRAVARHQLLHFLLLLAQVCRHLLLQLLALLPHGLLS